MAQQPITVDVTSELKAYLRGRLDSLLLLQKVTEDTLKQCADKLGPNTQALVRNIVNVAVAAEKDAQLHRRHRAEGKGCPHSVGRDPAGEPIPCAQPSAEGETLCAEHVKGRDALLAQGRRDRS